LINFTKKDINLLKKLQVYEEILLIFKKIEESKITKKEGFEICDQKIKKAYQKSILKNQISANTFPLIENSNFNSIVEHEATTSSLSENQIFYLQARGINAESASNLLINGFVKEVMQNLPMEFTIEAQKLLELKLEGSVG
jgi:hypothetical protein